MDIGIESESWYGKNTPRKMVCQCVKITDGEVSNDEIDKWHKTNIAIRQLITTVKGRKFSIKKLKRMK